MTTDGKGKDTGCTFDQNALRSKIVTKSKLTSVAGRAGIRQEAIFFFFVKVLCPNVFFIGIFLFSHSCLMNTMHSGKM